MREPRATLYPSLGKGLWLAALLTIAAVSPELARPAESTAPAENRSTTFAPAPATDATEDVLSLRDGRRLSGTILNETFTLRTVYGPLELPRGVVARIEVGSGAGTMDVVETVKSDRCSGFLETSQLRLKPPTGGELMVRREQVKQAEFAARKAPSGIVRTNFVVVLRNGDRLTGDLSGEPLKAANASNTSVVPLKDLESVQVSGRPGAALPVKLRAGGAVEGAWAVEDLELQLEAGPTVRLYQGLVAAVYRRFGPNSTATPDGGSTAPNGGNVAEPSPAPPANNLKDMIWISAGTFSMGSPVEEDGRDLDEGPLTRVTLTHGFWIGAHEVTQAEYQSVMGVNPSAHTGDPHLPVEKVTWREATDYCDRWTQLHLSDGTLPAGYTCRLPTEAEWEFACRAGTTTRFSYGEDPQARRLQDYAWFSDDSDSTTHPVGGRKPNPWGLYDMHGNVLEWCLDVATSSLPGGSVTNYEATSGSSLRVARGGSWLYGAKACRSANRDNYSETTRCSDVGFRVVVAPIE